jgi:hypothetical protein
LQAASTNQTSPNLKFPSKHPMTAVHIQSLNGRFSQGSARQNHSGFSVQNEMKMPAQQPRFEVARIEERLHASATVWSGGAVCLGKIATRTTESQIVHGSLAAQGTWQDMFNMESNSGGRFQQSAIFTRPARSSHDQLPVRFGLGHALIAQQVPVSPKL